MASPMPTAPTSGRSSMSAAAEAQEYGVQTRAMGLKVHYTFDKEAKINCLARGSHPLYVQTVPIDETNTIGVVDLRACVHTLLECSPELTSQGCDYTIYAVDYSEPDTPLVGQGLLSRTIESMRGDGGNHQPKIVTGRVTRRLLGIFGGENHETVDVRLKLSEVTKVHHPSDQGAMELPLSRPMDMVMTPTSTSEWNSFIQCNSQIGQPAGRGNASRLASPAPSQGPPAPASGPDSALHHQSVPAQESQRPAPTLVDPPAVPVVPAPSSRPSSRGSNRPARRKPPTGRPRGRPRKKPAEGHTSGYEDGTEGEEGPTKKRVKTTVVEKAEANPFVAGPESLRVAASNSSSLRNFRPIANNSDSATGIHLQEIPRAPTPIPDGGRRALPGRASKATKLRRESTLSQPPTSKCSSFSEPRQNLPTGQEDDRSPESAAPTPNYSEMSPADIGSSPPVQRATPYIRSSPPPSSPVLPPMPPAELPRAGSLADIDIEELFGEEPPQPAVEEELPPPPVRKVAKRCTGVPIQVFQLQNGPAGQDLVHITSYNTPHPSSSAPTPPEYSSLPRSKREPVQPQPRGPSAKRKRPRAPSPFPLAQTPPPTTAVEKAMSPAPIPPVVSTPNASPTPNSAPAPEPAQAAAVSDVPINDPIVQLATNLTPKNEEPLPKVQPLAKAPSQPLPPKFQSIKPKHACQLNRSQSAGPLALPSVPTGEPIGSSTSSQPVAAAPERPHTASTTLRRSASIGLLALPMPELASEPEPTPASLDSTGLEEPCPSDSVPPPSSPLVPRSNKNFVKKFAIKQRLEEAILNGEMPPFCSNCGAIETPTWRKIWVQEREGVPENREYSEKPGRVTAMEILERDEEKQPTRHRLVKKSLAPTDDKTAWQEKLLCNPCGIWLSKCKRHRPPNRWDKHASTRGQGRKRSVGRSASNSTKTYAEDGSQTNPTSEAYLPTDALEPVAPSSPKLADALPAQVDLTRPESQDGDEFDTRAATTKADENGMQSIPGSTHSRGGGTAQSPIDVEFDQAVGNTKRLLFPSPRKDEMPKVLCDIDVNLVRASDFRQLKEVAGTTKDKAAVAGQDEEANKHDDLEALSGSPAKKRPSTPPPNVKSVPAEPFKTPRRPTPNHRPITRSVSRSLRSAGSLASPSQQALEQTPTKTAKTVLKNPGSSARRHSSRSHQIDFDLFNSPVSRSIVQLLSEGKGFGLEENEMDLSSLPALGSENDGLIDFGNLLSTDGVAASSPPEGGSLGFDYEGSANAWASWSLENAMNTGE